MSMLIGNKLWLDGTTLPGPEGAPVGPIPWADRSGFGNQAVQGSPDLSPLTARAPNGRFLARFDAVAQKRLSVGGALKPYLGGAITIIACFRPGPGNATQVLLSDMDVTMSRCNLALFTTAGVVGFLSTGPSGSVEHIGSAPVSPDSLQVVTFTRSAGTGMARHRLRVNGAPDGVLVANVDGKIGGLGAGDLQIAHHGDVYNANACWFGGDGAAFLVFDRELPVPELHFWEDSLQIGWIA